MPGAVEAMKKVVVIDPKSADAHQVLFAAYSKLNKRDESVAEYTIYKALSEGKQRTGSQLKVWVDSAANRLGAKEQLTKTRTTEGYPGSDLPDGERPSRLVHWSKESRSRSSKARCSLRPRSRPPRINETGRFGRAAARPKSTLTEALPADTFALRTTPGARERHDAHRRTQYRIAWGSNAIPSPAAAWLSFLRRSDPPRS
jgi:hypothetical protein